jgi:hypothetical protein
MKIYSVINFISDATIVISDPFSKAQSNLSQPAVSQAMGMQPHGTTSFQSSNNTMGVGINNPMSMGGASTSFAPTGSMGLNQMSMQPSMAPNMIGNMVMAGQGDKYSALRTDTLTTTSIGFSGNMGMQRKAIL